MKGRANNRHHTKRMKAEFFRKQKDKKLWSTSNKSAGIYSNCKKTCSCWMCGNPRKHLGEVTLQEKKASFEDIYCEVNHLEDGTVEILAETCNARMEP